MPGRRDSRRHLAGEIAVLRGQGGPVSAPAPLQPVSQHSNGSGTEAPTTTAAGGWDTPVPLEPLAALPAFPVDVLPLWLGKFVKAVSVTTQTPTDLTGVLSLVVVSA